MLLQYFQAIELLAKLWKQWVQSDAERILHPCSFRGLDILLEELELVLKGMRYRLVGLSREDESYILELVVLAHVVRLSILDLPPQNASFCKLSDALSYMENLMRVGSTEPSRFILELQKSLNNDSRVEEDSIRQNNFQKLLNLFLPRRLTISTKLRYLKAELCVPGNNSENPLPFVAGLPTSVPLKVTLYNISSLMNLWVNLKIDNGATQFVYLDHNHSGECSEVTNLMCTLPFYNTPKGLSFILKISIGVECIHEKSIHVVEKHIRGPKCDLTYLCQDVDIYFSTNFED